jgi:hypothetical protein
MDENGKARGELDLVSEGPRLLLGDEKGRCRAALEVDPAGRPALVLLDKDGKLMWQAP